MENVVPLPDSDLPDIVRCFKLLKALPGDKFNILDQIENKDNLFHLLVGKGVEVIRTQSTNPAPFSFVSEVVSLGTRRDGFCGQNSRSKLIGKKIGNKHS